MSVPSDEDVGWEKSAFGDASCVLGALTEAGDAVLDPKKKFEGSTVPACLHVSTSSSKNLPNIKYRRLRLNVHGVGIGAVDEVHGLASRTTRRATKMIGKVLLQ